MKNEVQNILVPVDFRDPSRKAVKYAANFTLRGAGELLLLYVIETPGILAEFFASGDHLVRLTDQAREQMEKMAGELEKEHPGLKVNSRVERGKPYQKILEVAEQCGARMIILGENHQGTDMRQELGSTVYHVTLKSPVPVLTLKGDAEKPGEKIVVPLDLTRQARRQLFSALVYGLSHGAEVHLVSALIGGISMKDSRIYKKLKQARKTLEENGVHCHTQLFERSDTPPWARVLEYAEEQQAGMILVMTHQEGFTHDNYIGAFAHHIINLSKVPVLSLTSAAGESGFGKIAKEIVDPVGMLFGG